jgi:Acetyltransferase (GNAT) family
MPAPAVMFDDAACDGDLHQIMDLQRSNKETSVSAEEAKAHGFVTLTHEFELLKSMSEGAPQIVARATDGSVVGYALVMPPAFGDKIPLLRSIHERLQRIEYGGQLASDRKYFVMGQVCISKDFRGQGVFDGMYQRMKSALSGKFDCVVTAVAVRNTRSRRAHARVGFKTIELFSTPGVEDWDLILWDWLKS